MSIPSILIRHWLVAGALLCCGSAAFGQAPLAELHSVFPPGGQRGTTVEVALGGANLDAATRLVFSHPNVTAVPKPGPRDEILQRDTTVENVFLVTIGENVPPGSYEVRAEGRFGLSNSRLFRVGALPETNENGANQDPANPQAIQVNSVVNGRANGAAGDYFQFPLQAGQRVLLACAAKQIDSQMDPVLTLLDNEGRELMRDQDYRGADPLLDFTSPIDGTYTVVVHDFLYGGGGNHWYRLTLHDQPQVDQVFPPVVQAGQRATVTLLGRNLPGGQPAAGLAAGGVGLEQLQLELDAPPLAPQLPGEGAPLGINAALLEGFAYRWRPDAPPLRVGLTRDPIVMESEPNDSAPQATPLQPPCEAVGRLLAEADNDWYEFPAKQGDVYWIEVLLHRLGWPSDATLLVQQVTTDEQGAEQVKELAFVDDPGDRAGRIGGEFDYSTDDPTFRFQAPADGLYRVRVADNFDVGADDARVAYRLRIRRETPDFRLLIQPRQIKVANGNQVLMFTPALRRGEALVVQVGVERRDGFQGDIELSAEGLPAGLVCEGAVVRAGTNSAWLGFRASQDAAAGHWPVRVVGWADIQGERAKRYADAGTVVWGTGDRNTEAASFRSGQFLLSVLDESAPATLLVGEAAVVETSRGGKVELPINLQRSESFKEAVTLVANDLPAELKPADVAIPGDQSAGTLALAATNPKAAAGVYTFFLRADTKYSYSRFPESLTAAQADQQQLADLLAAQQHTAQAAGAAKTAAAEKVAAADAQAKQAQQALAAVKQNANAAEGELQAAEAGAQQSAAGLETARQELAAAEAAEKSAQERLQAITNAKAAQDKRVADIQKAVAPKDVAIALVSNPVILRVVDSPIQLTLSPAEVEVQAGQPAQSACTLTKSYGFDEAVTLSLELPPGVQSEPITIDKGAATGTLTLQTTAEAVGEHAVKVLAKAKFNEIEVQAVATLTLRVRPATE